jgi:hypothetical protein
LTVTVVATDVFGDSGQAQAVFTFDRKPVLTVSEPLAESVARPTIHVTLSCTDDDPAGCSSVTVVNHERGTTLATGSASIDTTISLASDEGRAVTLGFWAQDSASQVVGGGRRIYVESSPSITEVASVPKSILDVQPDRILYGDEGGFAIRTLSSGLDELIPAIPDKAPQNGFLSPRGAIFVAWGETTTTSEIYDWRDGTLLALSPEGSTTSVQVKGDFAIWSEYPNLARLDLQAGQKTLIPPTWNSVPHWDNDVAPNGDVVFTDQVPSSTPQGYDYHLFRWHSGTSTQLTNSLGLWDFGPRTDGTSVVFWRRDPAGVLPTSLVLLDGTGEVTLDPDQGNTSYVQRQVVNGWIAFNRRAPDSTYQVWLRSPSASELQVSFFGSSSWVGALSSEGRLTFMNGFEYSGGRHYLKVPGLAARDFAWNMGRTLWLGQTAYVALGRSLFRVEGSDANGPLGFHPTSPCRVLDTRNPDGPLGGPPLVAGSRRAFALRGSCGIPASAKSVSANVTVTQPTEPGELSVAPASGFTTPAGVVSFAAGRTRASAAIILLDADGQVAVQNRSSGTVHFILDVSGWFE